MLKPIKHNGIVAVFSTDCLVGLGDVFYINCVFTRPIASPSVDMLIHSDAPIATTTDARYTLAMLNRSYGCSMPEYKFEYAKAVSDCEAVKLKLHKQFADTHLFKEAFEKDDAIVEALKECPGDEVALDKKIVDEVEKLRWEHGEGFILNFMEMHNPFHRKEMEKCYKEVDAEIAARAEAQRKAEAEAA